MRTCTTDGCDKAHRARGLCTTHYNQAHQPSRHAKIEVACHTCGERCLKDVANTRAARFCSLICRDLWRLEQTDGDLMRAARAGWKPKIKPITYESCAVAYTTCSGCGVLMCHRPGRRKYCGTTCSNRARAVRRGTRHTIRRITVFERDGYLCWICGTTCDPTLKVPHRMAATVDHLVPQHFGGTHALDNLATAHLTCNSSRGASWGWPEAS